MSASAGVLAVLETIAKSNADFATVADKDCIVRVGQSMLERQAVELRAVCGTVAELIERARALRSAHCAFQDWKAKAPKHYPAPLSLRHRIRAEIAAGNRVWKQIAAEVTAAPIHMKVTVAVFFGAGAWAWIALFCGWLK